MTSLVKHITDLDRAELIRTAAVESYAMAVESVAQYIVEVDAALVKEHRHGLNVVRENIRSATDPAAVSSTQSLFRAQLRDYRDKSHEKLVGLKQEFADAVQSLNEVLTAVAPSSNETEQRLKAELETMRQAAQGGDLQTLRAVVANGCRAVTECFDEMRRHQDLQIAQFKDEIRAVQSQLAAAQARAAVDLTTGAVNRQAMESLIRRDVLRERQVALAVVKIVNYRDLEARYGPSIATQAVRALFLRLRNQVGESTDIGRWLENVFVAKLICPHAEAMRISREILHCVSGAYVCLEAGHKETVHVRVNVGICDYDLTEDCVAFLKRVDTLVAPL